MSAQPYNKSVNQSWTMKEQIFLHDNYFKLPIRELCIKLQRSEGAIHAKASDLGVTLEKKKSNPMQIVHKPIPVAPTAPLQSRVIDSPQDRASSRATMKSWSRQDDEFVLATYPQRKLDYIAECLNVTQDQLKHRIRQMKIEGRIKQGQRNSKLTRVWTQSAPVVEKVGVQPAVQTTTVMKPKVKVYAGQTLSIQIDNLRVKELTKLSNFLTESDIKFEIK